jgi:TIR domain/NACHT domain
MLAGADRNQDFRRIFISYSAPDRPRIQRLSHALREFGHEVWSDNDLSGGASWWNVILAEIRRSDLLLSAVSLSSIASTACRQERTYALSVSKPVLPVTIVPFDNLILPEELRELQVIRLPRQTQAGLRRLNDVIRGLPLIPLPEDLPPPPAAPAPPLSWTQDRLKCRSLSRADQWAIFGELREGLRDADTREPAAALAAQLIHRPDSTHEVVVEIQRLLRQDTKISKASSNAIRASAPSAGSTSLTIEADPVRVRFLRRQRESLEAWLRQSRRNDLQLALQAREVPDLVRRPVESFGKFSEISDKPGNLPARDLLEKYGKYDGDGLLILGAAGSGKTTLLIEFALAKLSQTEDDHGLPMPIYLPITGGAVRHQTFLSWATEEVSNLYWIPERVPAQWLSEQAVMLILDGLDDLADARDRELCIARINDVVRNWRWPLVVGSRDADYLQQGGRLRLGNALLIHPLTVDAVEECLRHSGTSSMALRESIRDDVQLASLARSPLILDLLVTAESGHTSAALPISVAQTLTLYISHCLADRKPDSILYSNLQSVQWLSELAHELKVRDQTVFLLERIDLSWLRPGLSRPVVRLVPHISYGMFFGLLFGLTEETLGLLVWLVTGLTASVLVALAQHAKHPRFAAISVATGVAIAMTVVAWRLVDPITSTAYGVTVTLAFSILGILLHRPFAPVEVLGWDRRRFPKTLLISATIALPVTIIYVVIVNLVIAGYNVVPAGGPTGLMAWATIGLLAALVLSCIACITESPIQVRRRPDEGVQRSIKNGIYMTVVGGIAAGLVAYLSFWTLGGSQLFEVGIVFGLTFGVLIGLGNGLSIYLQQITLRALLWREGRTPFHIVRWLSWASRVGLIHWTAGGGYRFAHPLLQEHLARGSIYGGLIGRDVFGGTNKEE